MGYVLRLKRNQLVGGNNNDEIYPITSTNAVYRGGKNLEDILDELGKDIDSKKVIEVSYNESTNSIKVSYSNGDVNNYPMTDCIEEVSFNNSALIFTKTDGTTTTVNIPGPNNGKLTLKKGNNVVEFTANSAEDKSITIPNVSVNNASGEYPKYPGSVTVDNYTLNLRALRIVPTFGVATSTSLFHSNELTDAIIYRNTASLTHGASDVCAVRLYDNDEIFTDDTAILLPRLPKVVAAVSLSGNNLVITYLEDTINSSQSETILTLPSGGSSVSVSNKNATLNAGSNVTVATVNVDNSATDLKVNVPNFVVNNNSIKNIEYCASESAYNSSSKDSNTLYFIPVS